MAKNQLHYEDPRRCNKFNQTHQYEDIGEVNFCSLEMNAYDSSNRKPVVKPINVENLKNSSRDSILKNLTRDAFPPPSRGSEDSKRCSKGSCWFTVATVIFMIVSSASLVINVLVIKRVIVTPECSKQGQ